MNAESFDPPSLETLAALLPGYEFEAFVAQGGMGAVYKARQRSLDRDVAIKILPREFGEDPEFRRSFETEAKAMARLNHPNLIAVYDFGDADGMPYIVMEYVNGKSLFHSAHNLAVDPVQAVTIVKGICDGLAHAHENGVIHRDIKPANILLTPKAEPKVGDFGLARPAGADSTGLLMGTPGYTAPEVIHQPDHADGRSDIFALGVVLYELLIGRCPPHDVPPTPPSRLVGCDPALDIICAIATHPSAAMRYANAEAMSAALDQWLRGATRVPPRTTSGISHPHAHAPRPAAGEPTPIVVKSRSGSSLLAQAAILALLIVATAFAWKKLRGLQDEKTAQEAAYHAAKAEEEKAPQPAPKPEVPKPRASEPAPAVPQGDPAIAPEPEIAAADPSEISEPADPGEMDPSGILSLGEASAEPAEEEIPLPPAIAELEKRARDLVGALEKDREKELAANTKTFGWDLDQWLKTLPKGDQVTWKPHVERLKRLAANDRVPERVDTDTGIIMSERMARIADFSARKQKSIDETFESKAGRIRDAYVARVNEAAAKARATPGEEKIAMALGERAVESAEFEAWLRIINPEEEMVDPSLVSPRASDLLVGRWTWGGVETVVFYADGTGENLQSSWKASWSCTEESDGLRVYEISWLDGKYVDKVTLSDDGQKLAGWSQIGARISAERKQGAGEAGNSASAVDKDGIVGLWRWHNGASVAFHPDGKAYASNGEHGKWEAISGSADKKARFRVEWKRSRSENELELSDNASTLEGMTKENTSFTCRRRDVKQLRGAPEKQVNDDPITGSWLWPHGGQILINADGTCNSLNDGNTATWKLLSRAGKERKYSIAWAGREGFIDTLTLDESSRFLAGSSNKGWETHAIRVPE